MIAELQAYDASADDESDDGGIQPMFRLPFFPIFGGGNNALEVLKVNIIFIVCDFLFEIRVICFMHCNDLVWKRNTFGLKCFNKFVLFFSVRENFFKEILQKKKNHGN